MECNYSNICFNRFEVLRRILKILFGRRKIEFEFDIYVVGGSVYK